MTPDGVTRACEEAIAACDSAVDAIVATRDGDRTFANTLGALEAATDGVGQASGQYAFMAYVADDGDVRDAARASEERIDKYFVDLSFREDLYRAVKAYAARGEALEGEEARLLEYELRDYRRNGFELPEGERARVRDLSDELVSLGVGVPEEHQRVGRRHPRVAGGPVGPAGRVHRLAADRGRRWGDALPGVAGLPRSCSRSWGRRGRQSCGRELFSKEQVKGGGANVAVLERGAGGASGDGGAARLRLVGLRTRTRCACRGSGSA